MLRTLQICGVLVLCAASLIAHGAEESAAAVIERYGLEQGATPVKERAGWRKPKKILLADRARGIAPALQPVAPEVTFVTQSDPATLADVDVIIGSCSAELIASARSVRWIQVSGSGVEDCVSVPAVRERNILVTNMQRIGAPIISEHVIAMMLAFTRGLDFYIPNRERRQWSRGGPGGRMTVVKDKTMLVVGLGGIGTEVARRAHALGMKVIATRASGRTGPDFVSYVGLPDELLKLASEADVVVNTAPLTRETTGIFNAAFFAKMKPSAYFINVARGGSVVSSALVDALATKKIAGAGLDVTDPEPLPPDHPLWQQTNVIITPHVSNFSDVGFDVQVQVISENLRRYMAGERMLSEVDVQRGY